MKLDPNRIEEAAAELEKVAATLKSEFFGLDDIIDQIVDMIRPWYTFPEIQDRPAIINLWGMTGVGKTALVRRLVELIGFSDRFVELNMGDHSYSINTINVGTTLNNSSILDGQPGVLLLDEFQNFRTIDEKGKGVRTDKYNDVWSLLSDGKLAIHYHMFRNLEEILASDMQMQRRSKDTNLPTHFIKDIKYCLRLPQSLVELSTMTVEEAYNLVQEALQSRKVSSPDYTKLLIFISGNLDEAYDMADATDDCDTDADVHHKMSKRITLTVIKAALRSRFKPEQIARLGNNHIIYPSLSRKTYEALIRSTCEKHLRRLNEKTGIGFEIDDKALKVIYDNGVFPTQGTRPVFTTIHKVLGGPVMKAVLWATQAGIKKVNLTIDRERSMLVATGLDMEGTVEIPVELDVEKIKKTASADYNTIVAAHEAGHAIVYAVLFKKAPQEVKINLSSFESGYMIPDHEAKNIGSRQEIEDWIAVYYAGRCAEEMVFGSKNVTLGAKADIQYATDWAVHYVRVYGMGSVVGRQAHQGIGDPEALLVREEEDVEIEKLLKRHYNRAKRLLRKYKKEFVLLAETLLAKQVVSQEDFMKLLPGLDYQQEGVYVEQWKKFKGKVDR